jgi:hypothetical protein
MNFENYKNKISIPKDIHHYIFIHLAIDLNKINNSIIFKETDTCDDCVDNCNKYILMHNILCDAINRMKESLMKSESRELCKDLPEKGERLKTKLYNVVRDIISKLIIYNGSSINNDSNNINRIKQHSR